MFETLIQSEELHRYKTALELIQSQVGLPDPAEACRAILKTASAALNPDRRPGSIHTHA